MNKAELRLQLASARLKLSRAEQQTISQEISRHLAAFLLRQPCRRLFLYTPFRGEVDLIPWASSLQGVELYLPVIGEGRQMTFHPWKPGDDLIPNRFGVREPRPSHPAVVDQDTEILVPCLGADQQGYRLGYGGGFYDVFLRDGYRTTGVLYAMGLFDQLPAESHDRPLQRLVSEQGILSPANILQ